MSADSANTTVDALEERRLAELDSYGILDTPRDPAFDNIAELVAMACNAPMASITFVGREHLFFKSEKGVGVRETPRGNTFCDFAIREDELFVVPDALEHPVLKDHPMVTSGRLRFYAAAILKSASGAPIGTLCAMDSQARAGLSDKEVFALKALRDQVQTQLELHHTLLERTRAEERLQIALRASEYVGTWDYDVINDRMVADPQFARLYGVSADAAAEGRPAEAYMSRFHPEDLERMTRAIRDVIRSGSTFEHEYRLMQPDGEVRWVIARGQVQRDETGRAVRFPGTVVDITERKRVELELTQTAAALAESEAKFRLIADAMPQMVWSTLPDGFHDYYNRRWYEFTGVPEGSTDGEGWNDMFHPDDQERAWARWRHSLETGEPYEIEYRLKHHSGTYRWTLGRALPMRDDQGRITRWFGTCTDIDDLKRMEEARELLSQELSHRIKNIFAVVSALIALSARQFPEAREFAATLRTRIAALARAHEFVRPHTETSAPDYSRTTLHAFLNDLFEPYAAAEGRQRIVIEGEDVVFDDQAATPVALLFHELATNAAKYGALSNDRGTVSLRTRFEDDRFILEWTERGGPPVQAAPESSGFGTSLTQLSVENQLGGRIRRQWDAQGLKVIADLPRTALSRRRAALA